MLFITIPKDEVNNLPVEGVSVKINGQPEMLYTNAAWNKLCWRDQQRAILQINGTDEGVSFICGDD